MARELIFTVLYKGEERKQIKIHELLELVGLNKEHALRDSRTSSREDRDSVSELQELWQLNRNLLSVMSRFRRWTCPFRLRLSIC